MGATDAFDTQAEDVSAGLRGIGVSLRRRSPVASAKKVALEIIQSLPDDCTLEEAAYRLYLRHLVDEAREDFREGRVFTQEELEAEAGEWLEP